MQAPAPTIAPVQAQGPIQRAGPQIRPQPALRPNVPTSGAPAPAPVVQPAPSRDQNGNDLNAQRPVVGPASAQQVHAALAANDRAVAAAPRPAPAAVAAAPRVQQPNNDLATGAANVIRPGLRSSVINQTVDDASK